MRRDHRPYILKRADQKLQRFFVRRFLRPQLDHLGRGVTVIKPWYVEIFGPSVSIGDYATLAAAPDRRVRLSVWPEAPGKGAITIGDYCLICPGVRVGSAVEVVVEENVMVASGAYITDSDWHDHYDRISQGRGAPVRIRENAWIGDGAVICKGVTVGRNAIVGAGSVVTADVPDNAVSAGNPARVVKSLDPEGPFVRRSDWLADPRRLFDDFDRLDRERLGGNSLLGWLRHLFSPSEGD